MSNQTGFINGLGMLPLLSKAKTRSISSENLTGEPGKGAMEEPAPNEAGSMLGKGWKVRPYRILNPGEELLLADIAGSGVIQHMWMAVEEYAMRNCVLRMWWDGEEKPSVETPIADFYCQGMTTRHLVNSLPIVCNPTGGFNTYWPMPFQEGAHITLENQGDRPLGFYHQVNYCECDVPDEAGRFHAQWRRAVTDMENPDYTIVDSIKGQGQYVGTFLSWLQCSNGWWGEGEIKFYMDGDNEYPTICGTGTEDYFGGAWGFYGPEARETEFSTPFLGLPAVRHVPNMVPAYDLYRWHIMDPIRFQEELKVTIQALGWWPNGKFQPLRDDIASVAYWYQREPHADFPELLPVHLRWAR